MDTIPPQLRLEKLDSAVIAVLRQKTPRERIEIAFALNRLARERLGAHLRFEHADWTEEQVLAEVARRMLWNSQES